MKDTFGADVLFEISDVEQFARLLSGHPLLASKEFLGSIVTYNDRAPATTVAKFSPVDPFEKGTAFAWQKEFRFVWKGPVTGGAFQIDVPEAASLLRRIR